MLSLSCLCHLEGAEGSTAREVTRDLNWGNYATVQVSYILRTVIHVRKKSSHVRGRRIQNTIGMYVVCMTKAGWGTESESYMGNRYYESGLMSQRNDEDGPRRNMKGNDWRPLGIYHCGEIRNGSSEWNRLRGKS